MCGAGIMMVHVVLQDKQGLTVKRGLKAKQGVKVKQEVR